MLLDEYKENYYSLTQDINVKRKYRHADKILVANCWLICVNGKTTLCFTIVDIVLHAMSWYAGSCNYGIHPFDNLWYIYDYHHLLNGNANNITYQNKFLYNSGPSLDNVIKKRHKENKLFVPILSFQFYSS